MSETEDKHQKFMDSVKRGVDLMLERGQRFGVVDDGTEPKKVMQQTLDGGVVVKDLPKAKMEVQRGERTTLSSGERVWILGNRTSRRAPIEVEIDNRDGVIASELLNASAEDLMITEQPIRYKINGEFRSFPVETIITKNPPVKARSR